MQFCYLILHYKNYEDTVKCIKSIYKMSTTGKIVVVDNGSCDGSGEKLQAEFNGTQCSILVLKKNLGFSAGNNYGYNWIRENENPEYIIVANNDVVFVQKEFEKKIAEIYGKTHFDVLGPDIYIPKHKDHQNPLFDKGITGIELRREIEQYKFYEKYPKKFRKRLFLHALKNSICSHSALIRMLYSKVRGIKHLDYRMSYSNVGLQGACLILSSDFIKNEDKVFDPEPFLYEEEVFLYYRCMRKNYNMVYSPDIYVRHEEGASFAKSSNSNLEKLEFMLKHHVKAREMLLEYLENEVDSTEKD